MSALDAIEAIAEEEVEACGFRWKIRRVTSDLVRRCRRIQIIAVGVPTDAEMAEAATVASLPDEQRQAAQVRLVQERLLRRMTDETIDRAADADRGLLMAGVVAVRDAADAPWEAIRLVGEDEPTDRTQAPPRLSLSALPGDAEHVLARAIWRLSTNGGAASERLARFRGGS